MTKKTEKKKDGRKSKDKNTKNKKKDKKDKKKIKFKFGGFGGLTKNSGNLDEEDLETLSYTKLHKMIIDMHPVDPHSNKKFDLNSRITVRNYYKKIFDVCCLYKLF